MILRLYKVQPGILCTLGRISFNLIREKFRVPESSPSLITLWPIMRYGRNRKLKLKILYLSAVGHK